MVTDDPLTEDVRPVGAPGAVAHALPPTTTMLSFDAALVPALFRALTRTKYVPAGTLVAVNVVAALNVSNTMMLLEPAEDPASMTYEDGASPPAGATHVNCTVLPVTVDVRLPGAAGAVAGAEATDGMIGRTGGQSDGRNSVAVRHAHEITMGAPEADGGVVDRTVTMLLG